jgi:hypothetical protein
VKGGVRKSYIGPEHSKGRSASGVVVAPCTCLAAYIGGGHRGGCDQVVAALEGQPPVATSKGWGERPGGGA